MTSGGCTLTVLWTSILSRSGTTDCSAPLQKRTVCVSGFISPWRSKLHSLTHLVAGPELQKIRAHLGLIQRDKAHILRRATHADGDSERKYAHRHHHRSRSMDGRRSTRNPPAVYTVEEYEEAKSHRPSHIDTAKAQRDHYYAHALPSPYKGEIEYTPTTDEDESSSSRKSERQSRGHGRNRHGGGSSRTTSYRSESKSTTAGDRERGRTRSRSVHTDRRVSETDEDDDSDADSGSEGYYDQQRRRRKRMSSAAYDGGGGGGRGRR